MSRIKQLRYRIGGIAAVAGVSILVAACGGGGSSASTTAASSGSAGTGTSASNAASNATPAAAKSVSVGTASGSHGRYLTGAGGRALYLWVADSDNMSSCSGACANAWPPLTTKGKPVAGKGVSSSDLGTIKRSDGSTQVTYKGHPLYYFIADKGAGTTNGEGNDGFGAKWWLVSPAGAAITSGGSSSSSGGSSGGAYGSSGSGGGSSTSGGGSSSWG
jgi:predicted lipoprotein with Yx(FWY)xxD motif